MAPAVLSRRCQRDAHLAQSLVLLCALGTESLLESWHRTCMVLHSTVPRSERRAIPRAEQDADMTTLGTSDTDLRRRRPNDHKEDCSAGPGRRIKGPGRF